MAYEINFCETKEQFKHLGEVVTGKTDGSPTGSDIDTSILSYTGQVRETLPALLAKLGWYSVGEWSTNPLISNDNQYVLYNGIRYVPLSTPYQVDSTANPDPEALVGSELKVIYSITEKDITEAQSDIVGGSIFKGSNGEYVQNGDTVPAGTTHLRVLVGGDPTIVAMSPMEDGIVSMISGSTAVIDGNSISLNKNYALLSSIAACNGLNESEVVNLTQGNTIDSARCFYHESSETIYFSSSPVTGIINSISYDDAGGFREISVDGLPVQISKYRNPDMTVIRNNVSKIASAMTVRGQDAKVVITGGSVSFSGFNYPSAWSVDGGGYATDQPFGLSSWSWLIRDCFVAANPSFKSIDQLDFSGDADFSTLTSVNSSTTSGFGMNCKVLRAEFGGNAEVMKIKAATYHNQYLMVSYASSNFGSSPATFDVNGVTYTNSSPDDLYRGRGYFFIPVGNAVDEIVIDNVNVSGTPGGVLYVYGVSGQQISDFKITGKGGYGTTDILAEYSTLIGAYTPNIFIMMVGGNDAAAGVARATYRQNIRDIVDNVLADEPDAVIVLCGPTPNTNVTSTQSKRFNHSMRKVVDEYPDNVSFIDMYTKLSAIPTSYWMYDYTHFNQSGDTMVFNIMRKYLFPSVDIPRENFVPVRENYIGLNYAFIEKGLGKAVGTTQLAAINTSAAAPSVSALTGPLMTAAYSGSGATSTLEVTWEHGYSLASLTPFYVSGATSNKVVARASLSDNSLELIAIDSAGNQIDIVNSGIFFRVLTIKNA